MRFFLWLGVLSWASKAAAQHSQGVCDHASVSSLPFCDATLAIDARVDDLVARIKLHEAVGLLSEFSRGVKSLEIPPYQWWNEALHGVALSAGVSFTSPTSVATSFPQIISTAASFNRSLFFQIGDAISTEARAFYNANHSGLTFWTPDINIFRDPRRGRGQETPGEDPFLTGEYAAAFVRGLQGEEMEDHEPTEGKFLKVSACCKAFSSYSQEVPRHRNDAIVTHQDQADTYFPAFESCVKRGHVSSVMCSYNAVNGIPACADKALLTGLVRGEWHFDGYITSDCGAIADIIYEHHFTQSPERTCATALDAGVDLNCGFFLAQHLPKAIKKGIVTKEMISSALRNLFRVQFRLGMFEKGGQPFDDIKPDQIDTPAYKELALDAAQQSIVLLKNEDKLLPLDPGAFSNDRLASIALIGPHFNASDVFLGNYQGIPSHIVTPLEGVCKYVDNVTYARGCSIAGNTTPDFDEAIKVAAVAEQVVAFVGLDQSQEREDIDRHHLVLPRFQATLIDRLMSAAKRPIVVVVISGGGLDLSAYKMHSKVGAMIFAGYLGQAGGQAIADVLFGTYNPSGRLTQTFYAADFVDTVSIYDMNMRPTLATGNPGRTYRFFTGDPVYMFGHGLSYTEFALAWQFPMPPEEMNLLDLSRHLADDDESCVADFNVSITNEGEREGRHTLLGYTEPPRAGADGQPLKSLVAFEVTPVLKPSQQAIVRFCLPSKAFSLAGVDGVWRVEPGVWVLHIGNMRREINVNASISSRPSVFDREVLPVD